MDKIPKILTQSKSLGSKSPRKKSDSDSLTSLFFPTSHKKQNRPHVVSNAQTGRTVMLSEFWLFYSAVLFLVTGVWLFALCIWALMTTHFTVGTLIHDYCYSLTATNIAYFVLPVPILCLLCFWITLAVSNDENSRRYLPLALILIALAISLLSIGVYIGYTKEQLPEGVPNNVTRQTDLLRTRFGQSLQRSLKQCGQSRQKKEWWNWVQFRFECCGVTNYTDWSNVVDNVPESCFFRLGHCRYLRSTGCAFKILKHLSWQTMVFTGLNCVALSLHGCIFIATAIIYLNHKKNNKFTRGNDGAGDIIMIDRAVKT